MRLKRAVYILWPVLSAWVCVPAVAAGADSVFTPRIVNGQVSAAYPSTGALVIFSDASRSQLSAMCSGTLIGCHTVLTAAHCVCSDRSDDAASCERDGVSDPASLQVFFQHAGLLPVSGVAIDPDYSFAVAGDLAIITLGTAVTGITPAMLNTVRRAGVGTRGTLAGFGTTGGNPRAVNDAGIKRVGEVTTAACPSDVPSDAQICWNFFGTDASTCSGDSGGPLFLDFGNGPLLAGVTSGGANPTCLSPDSSFDTDVLVGAGWIAAQAGSDLGSTACGDVTPVDAGASVVFAGTGQVTAGNPQPQLQFEVPAGADVLRVTLNGELSSGQGQTARTNDFDLFVQAGAPPSSSSFDCRDIGPTAFGACELAAPRAGPWYVLVDGVEGTGTFQVTATTFANSAPAACIGDCRGVRSVTPDDLVEGISIALGNADPVTCQRAARSTVSPVTVADLLAAVNNATNGCP